MFELVIPEMHDELFDPKTESFIYVDQKETKIQIEHSLISLKKWEQKWKKPFLGTNDKTYEEMTDYIRCMTLSHGVDQEVYKHIPMDIVKKALTYIEDPMTATTIGNKNLIGAQKTSRELVTAEIIYYWMITYRIPIELEKWHLNQLLTLIKVLNIKNGKQEKMDPRQAARERAALNAKRRAMYNSKG